MTSSSVAGAERPVVLVIGAGAAQYPFLRALAREYRLLGTDINREASGKIWLDQFLCVSATEEDRIVRFAQENAEKNEIARVMSFTSFAPQKAACHIAQRLGVPGPEPEMIDCALSKRRLSRCARRLGAEASNAFFARTPNDAAEFIGSQTGRFYLKPDCGGGGNGVVVMEAPEASRDTIAAVFAAAGESGVVIEPEALGREYIVSLVVRNGSLGFFSQGISIKLMDKVDVPVGQILGGLEPQICSPAISFARRWIETFELEIGIVGFEIVLKDERLTVLDLDLTYYVPLQLALRAGNFSIPDCLIGQREFVDAAQFPRACGLMHAVAETKDVGAQELAHLARSLSARYPESFSAAERPSSAFQTSRGQFVRIGCWQLEGTDQEDVKDKFQTIARDYYGSEIL